MHVESLLNFYYLNIFFLIIFVMKLENDDKKFHIKAFK